MVNLIAGKEIVPELIQHDFTAENVLTRLKQIIPDGPARDQMAAGLEGVRNRLSHSDGSQLKAADRACEAIFKLLEK
jgi:lipid-A-disaccharide synthase